MDCKAPDEHEKKKPTKKKTSSGCHNLFWSMHCHYKDDLSILAVMEIPWILRSLKRLSLMIRSKKPGNKSAQHCEHHFVAHWAPVFSSLSTILLLIGHHIVPERKNIDKIFSFILLVVESFLQTNDSKGFDNSCDSTRRSLTRLA